MGSTTDGALPIPLLLGALGYDMSYLPAPIASSNAAVWVHVVKDGHFNRSPSTRWEWDDSPNNPWCFYKGGLNWAVVWAYRDWVNESVLVVQLLIRVADLQPLFTEVQLPLNGHQLLHDLHDVPLGVLHHPLQGILEIAQAPKAANFPIVLGVVNLGERIVEGKFPLVPVPQMPPLGRGHGSMSGNSPVYLDRARSGVCSNTSTSLYVRIVGRVLDIGGHDESLVGPIPFISAIEWISDIDAVVEGVVWVVVNKPWRRARRLVFFISFLRVSVVDLRVFIVVVLPHR